MQKININIDDVTGRNCANENANIMLINPRACNVIVVSGVWG